MQSSCNLSLLSSVTPKLSFINFFPFVSFLKKNCTSSSPSSWILFSKLLFDAAHIPEAVPAQHGSLPTVALQEYTDGLGDGQVPAHVAELWFRHVDPVPSVTLS